MTLSQKKKKKNVLEIFSYSQHTIYPSQPSSHPCGAPFPICLCDDAHCSCEHWVFPDLSSQESHIKATEGGEGKGEEGGGGGGSWG